MAADTTVAPLLAAEADWSAAHLRRGSSCSRRRTSSVDVASYGLLEAPDHVSTRASRASSMASAVEPEAPSFWAQLLEFMGPGWLMSVAYIDPGNLEADLQCGALFGYRLLWALFGATAMGLGMQLVAARLGCATRRHLAEHCREHYPWKLRVFLWAMTELAIIGSDIQEVIGSSIGIRLLTGLPIPVGVVVTAVAAFGFLFLERLGTRPLELFFGGLILVLAVSMGGLFSVIKPDLFAVAEGTLVPRLPRSAVKQVVGMLGCVIMPHNLFLHSALVQSRVVPEGQEKQAVLLFGVESSAAIFVSFLINMSVVAVFSKGFYGSPDASQLGLASAGDYLNKQYGSAMLLVWAMGLCASGQSSTMTGAYAGQWVMQGYLQLRVKSWKRAVITRSMALCPTLLVAVHFSAGGGLDAFNECLNLLQAVVLPFAVVPLLSFAGNARIMGKELVLSRPLRLMGWAAALLVMGANAYMLLVELGVDASARPRTLAVLAILALYVAAVAYVAYVPWAAWRAQGDD